MKRKKNEALQKQTDEKEDFLGRRRKSPLNPPLSIFCPPFFTQKSKKKEGKKALASQKVPKNNNENWRRQISTFVTVNRIMRSAVAAATPTSASRCPPTTTVRSSIVGARSKTLGGRSAVVSMRSRWFPSHHQKQQQRCSGNDQKASFSTTTATSKRMTTTTKTTHRRRRRRSKDFQASRKDEEATAKDAGVDHWPSGENHEHLTICVFGASGDLAKKKIYPSLLALFYEGRLPKSFSVFGYARSKMSSEEFREKIRMSLGCRIEANADCDDFMEEVIAVRVGFYSAS